MSYRRIVAAAIDFSSGLPTSTQYGDIYYSASGAFAQAREVFLAGCDLLGDEARWCAREQFVIVETGFGLGVNFLATWQAWLACAHRPTRLHYLAVEAHPPTTADLERAHAALSEAQDLAHRLRAVWPPPLPGLHRRSFAAGAQTLTLTLAYGVAKEFLPQLVASVDALFLDGFAPQKNPELWSQRVTHDLARLAAADARLATWCCQEGALTALTRAGFHLEKRAGLAPKRHRLVGQFVGKMTASAKPTRRAEISPQFGLSRPTSSAGQAQHRVKEYVQGLSGSPRTDLEPGLSGALASAPCARSTASPGRVAIIGAGLAGSAIAERLAARGVEVVVIERSSAVADGASGNHAGVFRPLPAVDDNRMARLLRAGFLYAQQQLAALSAVRFELCGVLHLARDAAQAVLQQRIVAEQAPPDDYLRYVDCAEAAALAGIATPAGGWFFPRGGWINPPSLVRARLTNIALRLAAEVARIEPAEQGWALFDERGELIERADHVVLANGVHALSLTHAYPLRCARGQVTHLSAQKGTAPHCVVARHGYVTPVVAGLRCLGATQAIGDWSTELRAADQAENLRRLRLTLPEFVTALPADSAPLSGRVGLRPLSVDRLPIVGRLDAPRLWTLNGLGARGMVWSALCGELLAAQICGEPLPLEADLVNALDPLRFLQRPTLRRGALTASQPA